jgi:hypothetical protein
MLAEIASQAWITASGLSKMDATLESWEARLEEVTVIDSAAPTILNGPARQDLALGDPAPVSRYSPNHRTPKDVSNEAAGEQNHRPGVQ